METSMKTYNRVNRVRQPSYLWQKADWPPLFHRPRSRKSLECKKQKKGNPSSRTSPLWIFFGSSSPLVNNCSLKITFQKVTFQKVGAQIVADISCEILICDRLQIRNSNLCFWPPIKCKMAVAEFRKQQLVISNDLSINSLYKYVFQIHKNIFVKNFLISGSKNVNIWYEDIVQNNRKY